MYDTHIYHIRFAENMLPRMLKLLHISQYLPYTHVLGIDHSIGSHINKIIFKILQIKRFNIKSVKMVMVFVVIHLNLEYLQRGSESMTARKCWQTG